MSAVLVYAKFAAAAFDGCRYFYAVHTSTITITFFHIRKQLLYIGKVKYNNQTKLLWKFVSTRSFKWWKSSSLQITWSSKF